VIKSYYPKADEINRQWLLIDANGETLGRLATKIAGLLLGKHKPSFTPGVEMGDFVVVINTQKMGRHLLSRLKIYGGAEHPHTPQSPKTDA
jgi:ribosomal protein L13